MKSNSGTGWSILNTILGGGALATALGVGIPALVKANDAEDANCGGKGKCSENTFVNRYELAQAQEIAQLKADRETDAKLQKLYEQTVAENKDIREKMENESREHPKGERWDKETTLKVFSDAGHPLSNERYSENGVYWAMNMVYSDFFPMYKDDVSKYIEHAYLFLNDKDYSGKYAKEKWYAKKRA